MASDPDRPLLRLIPQAERDRPAGRPRPIPRPEAFPTDRQTAAFTPKFNRLAEVLNRDPAGLELRADPTVLAPERLLVFEVRGSIASFAAAIQRIPGIELVDEEELAADEDKAPVAYLVVPDIQALRNIEALWRRWLGGRLAQGETPWRDVFSLLRDLRPWGPSDRVQATDLDILSEEIDGRNDDDLTKLEIELVFRLNDQLAQDREEEVRAAVVAHGGRILSRSRVADIAYHALLAELPVRFVCDIIERSPSGFAGLEPVMHIRPQSLATTIEVAEPTEREVGVEVAQLGSPILALLDGVPVAAHALLNDYVVVDDQFGLEPLAPVADRVHGTAMASLIVHGDRNRNEAPLPRRIHVVPVLGSGDAFPSDRLIVDLIYNAIFAMRGTEPSAPDVVIVNVSLGNRRRPFHGSLSSWARLLDRLSYQFGILFVVSAGNNIEPFGVPAYATRTAFEDSPPKDRSIAVLQALGNIMAYRRVLSPAETVNGITVGACNDDAVPSAQRRPRECRSLPRAEDIQSVEQPRSRICSFCETGRASTRSSRTPPRCQKSYQHRRPAGWTISRSRSPHRCPAAGRP
jgi:Subtilase family